VGRGPHPYPLPAGEGEEGWTGGSRTGSPRKASSTWILILGLRPPLPPKGQRQAN
jgi:hypothetical protein